MSRLWHFVSHHCWMQYCKTQKSIHWSPSLFLEESVSVENSNWENKRSFWMTCQTKVTSWIFVKLHIFFQRPLSKKCTMGKLRHWTCWTFFSHYCSKYWLMTQQHRVVTKGSRCTALVTATLWLRCCKSDGQNWARGSEKPSWTKISL